MTVGELCRTLIVDDEMLIRQGIKHYLDWEQEGFLIVGEAANGQEALELIEAVNPHIIITDIVMPIMDGEELTRIVKERYPQIEMIILSSFGEFDYVRSTFQSGVVDYILKPKLDAKSLLKVLKKAASRISSFQTIDKNLEASLSTGQLINKLISGYEVNYERESISKDFPYSHYCLLGIDIRNHPSKDRTEFSFAINEKVEETIYLHLSRAAYFSFTTDKNIIAYLFNVDRDKMTELITLTKQLAESVPGIGFALTEEYEDFCQIENIYKTSLLKLLDYRFYFPDRQLIMKQELPKLPPKTVPFHLDWFTGELKRKHFDSAFSYLQDHVLAISKCYTMDVFEYKAFFGNIIFNTTILLGNMECDVKELENAKYTYFKAMDEACSAKDAVVLLEQFIEEANKCIFSLQNQPDNLNMKKLMEYIMDHYADPLTLTEVAKHFHFNPSYFSTYFSAHNKEGFIEYLNRIRIEEAIKLLIKGTVSISEISAMVGYSDHSYFCKVFKKINGLSPSQYRRKHNLR
ncbi:Protein-glutamate methylesterase/protein-glutamine glutaminase [Neobacillus rhizosphaerae]|uniref:Protein-glutamate methylesterase/protein-glutamine glutaminase n=1 Tax=Neobacillus rhizosphaerae TaxID=2880965 RepID=A0ABN8KTD0_9BACI|nr:response regulator transcription factor [Neobacillus rhizosphaerae]CAH2715819.1 Protein-glutamate methylesterase/protein-glutamine glutaminase [Neobacillus rhizosphaerae]